MNGYDAALTALDLAGTFAFGLGGGVIAVRHRLDLFGVLVLAVASALAGGLARDVLIDAPPAALADTRYLWTALGAGIVAFLAHPLVERVSRPVMLLDALGLGLFAVAGCRKALDAGLSPLPAVILGTLTAVGGGVVRDLLMAEVPRVLREEIYALAALAAAGIVVAGRAAGLDEGMVGTAGIAAGFALRVLSVRYGWRAPLAPWTR